MSKNEPLHTLSTVPKKICKCHLQR